MAQISGIVQERLLTQRLAGASFKRPEDVVAWLGAVQSQDFPGAKWALSLRCGSLDDKTIQEAFDNGKFLRTHVMRPTWHFVMPEDIRWMQELTAPRVRILLRPYNKRLGHDEALLRRSNQVIASALKGGHQLTRRELKQALEDAKIETSGMHLGFLIHSAELDGLICNGAMNGKQHTYALLEEFVPPTKSLTRDGSLQELARRYFTSHGPALAHDFAWWSGLTVADAKKGAELAKKSLEQTVVNSKTYWHAPGYKPRPIASPHISLLPNYDEYVIAYKDRGDYYDPERFVKMDNREFFLANHLVIRDGLIIGGWRRVPSSKSVTLEMRIAGTLNKAERAALDVEVERYSAHLGRPVKLEMQKS